ncbi:RteC domain-containing protein [Taibaiella chishuiensis]|uniref:RteC protein n=1 Tax=Taibaiella chishuiensis TaxID=1434707 RepID=A0A2P8D0Q5_9BACT|nr:RteC domain-containing protein [Taibaiella chishuiensis]PSK90795.1 RteC protein [Taibaiella chishuiensis]
MNTFTTELRLDLDRELRKIERTGENIIQIASMSFRTTETALKKLKDYILRHEFKSVEEEINFFKDVKPHFLQDLMYYMRVFFLESQKPLGSRDRLLEYYNTSLNNIGLFIERNQQFHTYYKTANTSFDTLYFTRDENNKSYGTEYALDIDPRFSTLHSFKLAKIQAYERLNRYILGCIDEMNPNFVKDGLHKSHLNWTDSKVALIELAYALHARGAIDSGKAGISQLIRTLEKTFNVELNNFYRMYLDMSLRKKNKTPFLDSLKEYLDRYIVEGDR